MIYKFSKNTSVTLDLMRAIASQMVVVGHGISFMGILTLFHEPNFPWMQNIGVVVFFVLSGLVIANSTLGKLNNKHYNFKIFFIERFSRIYSVLIPSLIFIAVLDGIYFSFRTDANFIGAYNISTFIGNLLMLQDYPVIHPCTSFSTGRPLWTLAIWWWFYMFFGWLMVGKRLVKSDMIYYSVLAFFAIVPFFNSVSNGRGQGLAIMWAMGMFVALLLTIVNNKQIVNKSLVISFILFILAAVRTYHQKTAYDLPFAFFLSAAVYFMIVFLNSAKFVIPDKVVKIIRFFSNFSFTLYLIHYTVFVLLVTQKDTHSPYLLFIIGVIISNVVAFTLAYYTEMRHRDLRSYLLKKYTDYSA